MKYMKEILTLLLLTFTLSVTAQQETQQLGCRRGTPRSQHSKLLRSMQQRQPGGDFYTGERHQLTVLVAFSDLNFEGDEATTLEKWSGIMNTENYSEKPYIGSAHDYFYAQSYGQFNLIFDLQYVQLANGRARYASNSVDDENSQFLVNEIMDVLQERDIDWSQYDWNEDGFVNQLLIIFAGKGMNDGGDDNSIWAHQWWLSQHKNLSTEDDTEDYCEPRSVTYNDKTYSVDAYCAVPELGGKGTFGTMCHEFSHCFGFPDFYNGTTKYVGSWDLMDYGNYNGNGYVPCAYSAHERWLMGWLTPEELAVGTTVDDMPALNDKAKAYLIRNDGYKNEYYIVENRQQSGWDAQLPGSGIVIFHIDYDPDLWISTTVMPNTYNNKHYTIIPANNNSLTSEASGWAYPYKENNELTNTSAPAATLIHENSDGTLYMNKSLTGMAITDGLASFVFGENRIHFPDILNKVTFYHGTKSFLLPSGVTASVVTSMTEEGKLVSEKIVDQTLRNGILPSNTAVILTREDSSLPTTVSLTEVEDGEAYTGVNLLHGSDEACMTDIYGADFLFYKLALGHSNSTNEDVYSWYWGADNGGAFDIEAHKAWLALPQLNAASRLDMTDGSQTTMLREIGIDQLVNDQWFYNLQGHRVLNPTKGLYIHHGKKIMIR